MVNYTVLRKYLENVIPRFYSEPNAKKKKERKREKKK